jgi:hypothetical protein
MLPQEQVLLSSLRRCISELTSARTAALVPVYAGSFRSSGAAYGLTKLLLYWHDNHCRLLSVAFRALLNTLNVIM